MSHDVVTAGHGASDVIFLSELDPFGPYFSGLHSLMVWGLCVAVAIVVVARSGRSAGRVAFFLGLVILAVIQIAPYIFPPDSVPRSWNTFLRLSPGLLMQMVFVAAFWLPVFWLTVGPGKAVKKLLIAVGSAIVPVLPIQLLTILVYYRVGFQGIADPLPSMLALNGVLLVLHMVFIFLAPRLSGAKAGPKPA